MTTISYLIGKTVSSRQNLLQQKMCKSEGDSFLHIVPTKGIVMELETKPEFWLERRLNTLTGLIHHIFEEDIKPEKYPDFSPIDQQLKQMLIKKTLQNRSLDPQGLSYFHSLFKNKTSNRDYPGIYNNISGFFSTLYQNNYEDIYAHDLGSRMIWHEENEASSTDEKYALESDLLWLMGDYEELKREVKGYDEDDIFINVRDYLREKKTPPYMLDFNVMILDGLTHISRIEEDILYHLINSVEKLWWLIDYDSNGDDPLTEYSNACGREGNRKKDIVPKEGEVESCRIYYPLISLMDELRDSNTSHNIERADEQPFPNPFAKAMYTNQSFEADEGYNIKIGSFPGEVDEIKAIASEIKRLIMVEGIEKPVNPGDIRVIFPELNDYSSLVSEIFNEYGLPFSLTKGIPLSSHPLSHIFLKIFQLPLEGFKREDIFNVFSSALMEPDFLRLEFPEFSINSFKADYCLPGDTIEKVHLLFKDKTQDDISQKPNISLFDTGMRRCGIDRLGTGLENIGEEKVSIFKDIYLNAILDTKNPGEKNSIRLEYYIFLYQCSIFSVVLTPFISLMNCDSPAKIMEIYKEIIHLLGFPINIIDINNHDIGFTLPVKRAMLKRDIRAFSILNELLHISHKEINLTQQLFDINKSDALLFSFYNTFKNRIDNEYLLDEKNPDVIRVSQWLETRGRSFDYVFAGGLTASRFPLKDRPDFIIPEASRAIFRLIDPVDYSKYLFSHLLKNYGKKLYLTYPENISEKPVQPSQVIQDFYALTGTGTDDTTANSLFSWEENQYYSSNSELLNSKTVKKNGHIESSPSQFNLKNIINKHTESDEDIIRGVKSFASRLAGNNLFEYDGLVAKTPVFAQYREERSNIFSPSSLETLANCPMNYLFKYVFNMKDLNDVTPEASARDVGEFVHDILSLLFKKLIALKTNISDIGIDQAFSMAKEVIEEYIKNRPILDKLDFSDFYQLELFSGLDSKAEKDEGKNIVREGIIASLLRFENTEFKGRIPQEVEYEFGSKKTTVPLGNIFLRGYIDRFDRDINSPGTIYVYDYKTGSLKSSTNIKKGLAFQLPVYIRALEAITESSEISAYFYSLKRNAFLENAPLKYPVISNFNIKGTDISGVTLIDNFISHLSDLTTKGIFHHSADCLTCEYCKFKYACHRDERRMEYLTESNPDLEIYSGKRNLKKWQAVDSFRKEWKKIAQSMEKALTLKTEKARKKHFETVMAYKNDLILRRDSLPFTDKYIDGLLGKIDRFEFEIKMIDMI